MQAEQRRVRDTITCTSSPRTCHASVLVCSHHHRVCKQGPPGTGKPRTIPALVEALARSFGKTRERQRELGQILVCADTNAATDNIAEGVVAAGIDIVRLGQAARVGACDCNACDSVMLHQWAETRRRRQLEYVL